MVDHTSKPMKLFLHEVLTENRYIFSSFLKFWCQRISFRTFCIICPILILILTESCKNAEPDPKPDPVYIEICSNGRPLTIDSTQLNLYLADGDFSGDCPTREETMEFRVAEWLQAHVEGDWNKLEDYVLPEFFLEFGNIFNSGHCNISSYINYMKESFEPDSTFEYSDLIIEDIQIMEKIGVARYSILAKTTSKNDLVTIEEHRTYSAIFRPFRVINWKFVTSFYVVNKDGEVDNYQGTEEDSTTLFTMIEDEYHLQMEALSSRDCGEYMTFWQANSVEHMASTGGGRIFCTRYEILEHICTKPYADFEYYQPLDWMVRGDVMIGNYDINWVMNGPLNVGNWITIHIKDEDRWKYAMVILDFEQF